MQALFGLAALLIVPFSNAGIAPGSKDLGAIWFIGDSITQSNADGDVQGSPRKALYDLLGEVVLSLRTRDGNGSPDQRDLRIVKEE